MPHNRLFARLPDLLDLVGATFDISYRVSGDPLKAHFERVVTEALASQVPTWGEPGATVRLDRVTDGALTFLYRPHLFPGMDDTLRLGHLVQFHNLPRRLPTTAPVTVAAMLESFCHLSGDLFGWREGPDGSFLLWLVDASGHGVRAGFAALVLRLLIDESDPELPLPELVNSLEQRFGAARNPDDQRPLYATGVFLRFAADGSISFLSAGHPPMLVRGAAARLLRLDPTCRPIALLPPMDASAQPLSLAADETVFLCTDGLLEAGDADGRPFGEQRLTQELVAADGDPHQIAASVYAAVAQHHDLTRLDDDLTFLVLRRNRAQILQGEENQV